MPVFKEFAGYGVAGNLAEEDLGTDFALSTGVGEQASRERAGFRLRCVQSVGYSESQIDVAAGWRTERPPVRAKRVHQNCSRSLETNLSLEENAS